MKRLKNNKGVTGIDIVVSVTLIVITLGIVMTVYSSYSNQTKEVERTSAATNLAMKVIESLETKELSDIKIKTGTTDEIDISSGYGVDDIPNGYRITAKKINPSNTILQNIAFQVDVTVSYNVGNEAKKVTLSTIKKYNEVGEAEAPDMTSATIDGCIPVKYDSAKGGYVKTDEKDSEWYSISSKVFPVVVNTGSNNFDRNGVIQLEDCSEIYVWMPSYGKDLLNNYRFCDDEGKIIEYKLDPETKIRKYEIISDSVSSTSKVNGGWIQVDSKLKSSNDNYNTLKNNIFTWQ